MFNDKNYDLLDHSLINQEMDREDYMAYLYNTKKIPS